MDTLNQRLETDRLILRILYSDDIPEIEKMHADPEVMKLSGSSGTLDKVATHRFGMGKRICP